MKNTATATEFEHPVRCTACGETCEFAEAKHDEGYVYCPACIAADPQLGGRPGAPFEDEPETPAAAEIEANIAQMKAEDRMPPTGATRYRAIVVDLVPGVSADQRASECTSEARANTIEQAEREAIAASAENCNRRVYVVDDADPLERPVKGPYILRAAKEAR